MNIKEYLTPVDGYPQIYKIIKWDKDIIRIYLSLGCILVGTFKDTINDNYTCFLREISNGFGCSLTKSGIKNSLNEYDFVANKHMVNDTLRFFINLNE